MSKLISYAPTFEKSISWKGLQLETKRLPLSRLESVDWEIIRELHILGSWNGQVSFLDQEEGGPDYRGCYLNSTRTCLVCLGMTLEEIERCLTWCKGSLSKLDIRFTSLSSITLPLNTNIRSLNLSANDRLETVSGLELQKNLVWLDLGKTRVSQFPPLRCFSYLECLNIRETLIKEIEVEENMNRLHYFDATGTDISDAEFLLKFPALVRLNLGRTMITGIPSMSRFVELEGLNLGFTNVNSILGISSLTKLRTLNVGHTKIQTIENIVFPQSLRSLCLAGTAIKSIPESISELNNLRRLDLSGMQLLSLPKGILKLDLDFVMDSRYGINLYDTTIENVDMEIFKQPRYVIEAWLNAHVFSSDTANALNEIKVVFLGDGGAGKSLTIQRLLAGGAAPGNFDGEATPGISITSRNYTIGNSDILVHFWDFGGQEILHSMHRMFLTKRTFYVVLINARDNTQDERARYWLHNIKSFASGSPVLIVLNQIDQNPSAAVNETSLRELSSDLTAIVKLSARDYSLEKFHEEFENVLLCKIGEIPHINEPFLPSWSYLKLKLQNMQRYYIDSDEFSKMSDECGVEENPEVRSSLLDWFSDLGVSFCYRDSSVLSNYMVLRPDWITNAIYIILFNGSRKVRNGLISHEDIHQMLKHPEEGDEPPKCVMKGVAYSPVEVEYVLGVIRKFRLSYRINDDTEFIPMLCDRNEKACAAVYTHDETALEFHMEYRYLPNNVLHRLMVEMRLHLDIDNVWLTGMRLSSEEMGVSALVKAEDNVLKIYVKSKNDLHPANTYLSLLKGTIKNINDALGLEADESIVYKRDGISETFEYDYLIDSYEHGNRTVYSRAFKENIEILDILNQTDRNVGEQRNKLLKDIFSACFAMQGNNLYWDASEDERNTFVRDMLRGKGYYIADQTRNGISATGKSAGELDIEIRESADKPWAIFEALNLKSFSPSAQKYWNQHFSKLTDNYNPAGLQILFLVSYMECSKDKFKELWLKYAEHISRYSNENYALQKVLNHKEENFYLRSAECVYDRGGLPVTVYHICVRLGK